MDAKIITKWESRMYNYMVLVTVFLGIALASRVAGYFITDPAWSKAASITYWISLLIAAGFWTAYDVLAVSANSDRKVYRTIFNEMRDFFKAKAFKWGFWSALVSTYCMVVICDVTGTSPEVILWGVLFGGVMGLLISGLIYNK